MTFDDLIDTLIKRKALIVHCSRPGKANEGTDALLFPHDMKNATEICANQHKDLSCSVVWPQHIKTFGAVGIILRPRSTSSIMSICNSDAGTWIDPQTGKKHGDGVPFSAQAVNDTFANPTNYNEWTVTDADTVGIFINFSEPLEVAKVTDVTKMPGYDPAMGHQDPTVVAQPISLKEIMDAFPTLPIYAYCGTELSQIGLDMAVIYS